MTKKISEETLNELRAALSTPEAKAFGTALLKLNLKPSGLRDILAGPKTDAEKDIKTSDTEDSSRTKNRSATLQGLRRQRQHVESKD